MKLLFLLLPLVLLYRITLEPNAKVCFFEPMEQDRVFGLNFEVVQYAGDHSTVDLEVQFC